MNCSFRVERKRVNSKRHYALLIFLTLLLMTMSSSMVWAADPQFTNFGYDKCTGHIYAEYYSSNDYNAAPDDYLQWGILYYKDIEGNWVSIIDGSFIGRYGADPRGKFFETTNIPGGIRGFASERYPVFGNDGDNNAEYRARIVLFNMPTNAKYPYELRLHMNWREDRTFGSDDISDHYHNSHPIEIQSITNHSILSASIDQCGQVVLSWDNPQQAWESGSGCSIGSTKYFDWDMNARDYFGAGQSATNGANRLSVVAEYKTDIYRDDELIGTVTGNASTFTDTGVADYREYNYRLKRRIEYRYTSMNVNNYYRYGCGTTGCYTIDTSQPSGLFKTNSINSAFSSPTLGRTLKELASPPNFAGSRDECGSAIELTWDWNSSTDPLDFIIYRSSTSTGTYTQIGTVDGGQRGYFDDQNIVRGIRYYYQIKTRNLCGILSNTYSGTSGVSPPDPSIATEVTATLNSTYDTIYVEWIDNAINETKYQIIRQDNLSNTVVYEVNKNEGSGERMVYKDGAITSCRSYTYFIRVFSDCALSGYMSASAQTSGPSGNLVPPPNLGSTFDTGLNKLTASKGYFSNRVELSWRNNNNQHLEQFKIYRKIYGTTADSTLIGVASTGSGFFLDNSADARVYYKYTIVGVKNCNNVEVLSNVSEDIGFRNPTGNVSGHIEYTGGIALKGAKVIIQQAGSITGSTVKIQTTSGDARLVSPAGTLGLTNQLRAEFWIKPIGNGNQNFVEKSGTFAFRRIGSSYVAILVVEGNEKTINVPLSSISTDQWNHVSLNYDGDQGQFKLFVNGNAVGNVSATGNVSENNSNIVIGGGDANFLMDEFRVLKVAGTDEEINIDHGRYLNGSTLGMVVSLRFDENYGTYAYDGSSQNSIFNGRHFSMQGNVSWSTDKPSTGQLSYFGITDALGNYNVSGISFSGSGENFTIIPSYLTHSFTPNSRQLYIGDVSTVFNNQDFIDNSSFTVSGELFYGEVVDLNNNGIIEPGEGEVTTTACPVPDATLKIDGNVVIAYGQPVKTDANGKFTIEVPIGNHFIEIESTGHTMAVGRFPAQGVYNFQDDLAGINFVDSTKRILVGRIVGGLVEANKVPGLGRSKNNIGQAKVVIAPTAVGAPCYSKEIITDLHTGEYVARVYPLKYDIKSVELLADPNLLNADNFTNTKVQLDLRNVVGTTVSRDTVRNSNDEIVQIDTMVYHVRHDMIHRVSPTIDVVAVNSTAANAGKFIGETSLVDGNTTISLTPTGGNWGPLGYPVFKQEAKYAAKITASENYTNLDNNEVDRVPLSGKARILNELVDGADPNASIDIVNGSAIYEFVCGLPNTNVDANNPEYTGTKTIQIDVTPTSAQTKHWEPNGPGNGTVYRAYVLGSRVTGAGILTQGPEKVDYILRDPPGSGSYAVWESGKSVTTTKKTSFDNSGGTNLKNLVTVGSHGVIGLGLGVVTDNFVAVGLQVQYNVVEGSSSAHAVTETNLTTISTRSDDGNVGSSADIFIGKSNNIIEGLSMTLELVDETRCAMLGNGCFGPSIQGKRLALVPGVALAVTGIATRFAYTQSEIENVVIPKLESLRNTLLNGSNSRYTSALPANDPRFGSNNDDPLWGALVSTTTPTVAEPADTTGSSYTFRGYVEGKQDSVRIVNNQIALWKRALARNEREKIACVQRKDGYTPIDNFTLGSAIIQNSYSKDNSDEYTESWEHSFSQALIQDMQILVSNTGVKGENSVTFNETWYSDNTDSFLNMNTFTYTLTDGDPGDIISVDVYGTSSGNVFVTRGGQTMCPYEGEVVSHYYDPAKPDAFISSHTYNAAGYEVIQVATQKREEPRMVITPVTQVGVPSKQAAVYQLNLSNTAITNYPNDVQMRVYVASQSNPHGAVVKIDGLDPNTLYTIPKGASVTKTLTIERGPVEVNYDSLMIIFASACSDEIADTVYVSAHFIPTCTDLKLTTPNDNWVFNNGNNNTANIVVSEYNYNYGAATDNSVNPPVKLGFNKIGLEYKPANSSSWTEYAAFYKYPGVDQQPIPTDKIYTQYTWDISTLPDGNYELRAVSYCLNKDGSQSVVYSPVNKGVMDRINPVPFGTPSPADGILDPEDDIVIKFNESIEIGAITSRNFDIRGVLNGSNSRQSESVNFDGVDDYAEVTAGASLQKRSFTFEFWAMLTESNRNQTVVSQGVEAAESFSIGFDADNRLTMKIGSHVVSSANPILTPTVWHHYAAVYDYPSQTAYLYMDGVMINSGNTSLLSDYNGQGKLVFGKSLPAHNNFLHGNLNDVRLWSKTRTIGEIVRDMNKDLYSNTTGLVYNWKMNEAEGTQTIDVIRSRNAVLHGASWRVTPNGYAAQFDGIDDRIDINSGTIGITQEMDFTLEFWFKSSQSGVATLFSNGKGDGLSQDSLFSWNIQKDASGKIHVYHRGIDFVATEQNFFDNNWHHFALVLQRSANITCYIDGNLQKSMQASAFRQMGGATMYLGARGYFEANTTHYDNYFNGSIDEFRFWNMARKIEQIKRDKQNRMKGDEFGLLAFVPFESYELDPSGIPLLTASFKDFSTDVTSVPSDGVVAQNGTLTTSQTPVIKLPRQVGAIDFVTSVNNDQIVITPTTSPELLENVTIDITVKDIYDLRGNKMTSPKTWIAYVNKNQVLWKDVERTFTKKQDDVITFTAEIVNKGGASKEYSIGGLPSWLSATRTSGTLSPNSSQSLSFTVPAGTAVGHYDAELTLTTDFGYAEILRVSVQVKGDEPAWTVNPSDFKYGMSVIGEIRVDGIIATSTATKIAAFNGNTVCGVAYLTYLQPQDRYEVFLNIYSNKTTGDSISFRVYDATTGITFVNVTPKMMFVENDIQGTVNNPITFVANSEIRLEIPLNAGWTWVSLPLKSKQLQHSNLLMESVSSREDDIVRTIDAYDQYTVSSGWHGTISSSVDKFKNNTSYQIKSSVADALVFTGSRINPADPTAAIHVVPGWNWIGYVATKNSEINTAMSGYNAVSGDILKSQYEFAVYDAYAGWVGSLSALRTGQGYMLKSTNNSTFHYPASVFYGNAMTGAETRIAASGSEDNSFGYLVVQGGNYEKTMSVIAQSNLCESIKSNGSVVLAAYDDKHVLRGFAKPTYSDLRGDYVYYLNVFGNVDGESLHFAYVNEAGLEIPAQLDFTFTGNKLVGVPSEPIHVNVASGLSCFAESMGVGVYPNPFSTTLKVVFASEVNVKLKLTDIMGKEYLTAEMRNASSTTLDVSDKKLPDGVYILHISGDVYMTTKVIKVGR
jgi:hypothetical protein